MKRNVLITGASSGIGKAIAYVFALIVIISSLQDEDWTN